jgi:hypothetical protein
MLGIFALVRSHARTLISYGILHYSPLLLTPCSLLSSLLPCRRAARNVVLRLDLPSAGGHSELRRGRGRRRRPRAGWAAPSSGFSSTTAWCVHLFGSWNPCVRENRLPERQLRLRLRRHRHDQDERRGQLVRRGLLRRHLRPHRARRRRPARGPKLGRANRPARRDDGEPERSQQRPARAELRARHARRSVRRQGPESARDMTARIPSASRSAGSSAAASTATLTSTRRSRGSSGAPAPPPRRTTPTQLAFDNAFYGDLVARRRLLYFTPTRSSSAAGCRTCWCSFTAWTAGSSSPTLPPPRSSWGASARSPEPTARSGPNAVSSTISGR